MATSNLVQRLRPGVVKNFAAIEPWAAEVCLGVSLLGLVPLLVVQCGHLWELPHFQFFPLAWLAMIALIVTRGKVASTTSVWRSRWGIVLWSLGLIAGVIAAYKFSPWLGHAAAIFCISGWELLRLASIPWIRWLGWTLLVWVTLPLPLGMDRQLVNQLQTISSESAGALLDLAGVVHYRQGNLIEIREGKLFVDEACSGVDSLYSLFAMALIMMLWQRRPLIVGLFTLLSVPVWAWLGNVLRLILIVVVLDQWQLDLSHGWKHTVLGLVMFALSSGCLFVTLGAFTYLFKRFSTGALPRDRRAWHLAYNALVYFPEKPPALASEEDTYFESSRPKTVTLPGTKKVRAQADHTASLAASRALFMSTIVAALLTIGLSVAALARSENGLSLSLPHFKLAKVDSAFHESAMPETLQGAQRYAFLKEERSPDSFFGEYTRAWKFRDARGEMTLSVDFPFRGFHPLWVCYTNAGNTVEGSPVILQLPGKVGQVTDDSQVVRVKMKDEFGYTSYLWFSLFESNGRVIAVENSIDSLGVRLRDRLFGNGSALDALPVTYQFQLYLQSGSDLKLDELERHFKIYSEALPHAVEQVKRLNAE